MVHRLTNGFEQSSICFWQSEVIETNCSLMKQFYCDKLHCIRSDIVPTVVKFVSVKYSMFQIYHECFKQIEDCSNPKVYIAIKNNQYQGKLNLYVYLSVSSKVYFWQFARQNWMYVPKAFLAALFSWKLLLSLCRSNSFALLTMRAVDKNYVEWYSGAW